MRAFHVGWRFGPASAGSDLPDFDDSGFASVTLPHTVTPLSWRDWDPAAWERVWAYRKRFDAPDGARGQRVFVDFEAAMTRATVTLNGVEVTDHLGGYLPFSVEITGLLRPRGNVLAVRLDSTFNLNVPPDRPAPEHSVSVDYWQPGGIYRDVRLRVVPPVFLADVFAKPVRILDPAARQVEVQVTVNTTAPDAGPAWPDAGAAWPDAGAAWPDAGAAWREDARVEVWLLDDGRVVASGCWPGKRPRDGVTSATAPGRRWPTVTSRR